MRAVLLLSLCALTTACVEDTTLGVTVQPVQLPMGETIPLAVTGTLPPLDTIELDADDPDVARLSIDARTRRLVVTAISQGETTLHLTFARGGALHVPTTVMPPPIGTR